jgi:hypothetical protein
VSVGLTDKADTDSIRVKVPSGTEVPCTIEQVSFDVNRRAAKAEDESGREGETRLQLKAAEKKLQALQADLARSKQQDRFVQDYMSSMLQSARNKEVEPGFRCVCWPVTMDSRCRAWPPRPWEPTSTW